MNIEELKRLAEPLAAPNGSDSSASWWDSFHRAANPAAILELIQQRDELLAALKALDRGCRDPRCIGVLHGLDLARTAIAKAEG